MNLIMLVEHDGSGRFFVKTEHGEAELNYRMINDKIMSIYHTFTPPEDRGKGIADSMATEAFRFAEKSGFKIRPDCPYIPEFVKKHVEFSKDLVDYVGS